MRATSRRAWPWRATLCVTGRFTTDCYRLFSTMCRLSRSPSSWFSASPAQKYILRQIRQRDEVLSREAEAAGEKDGERSTAGLDVCLLVMYGHILFASMSYHFALSMCRSPVSFDFLGFSC